MTKHNSLCTQNKVNPTIYQVFKSLETREHRKEKSWYVQHDQYCRFWPHHLAHKCCLYLLDVPFPKNVWPARRYIPRQT